MGDAHTLIEVIKGLPCISGLRPSLAGRLRVNPISLIGSNPSLCSADGSTHIESNALYRKVKHRYRPHRSLRQRPTSNLSAPRSGSARGVGRSAGSHTPSTASESLLTALAQHISHSHSGIDEKRPTEKCVVHMTWFVPFLPWRLELTVRSIYTVCS